MKSNLQTFTAALAHHMREIRARDPQAYSWPESDTDKVAVKLTGGLLLGGANKDGAGIRATLRALGIKDTYKAIRAYLSVPPLIEWKCATCKLSREAFSAERLPIACPACGSERDAAHGPQPLTAADLIASVKAEEIALEATQADYAREFANATTDSDRALESARADLARARELHTHLARRLALPFTEVL